MRCACLLLAVGPIAIPIGRLAAQHDPAPLTTGGRIEYQVKAIVSPTSFLNAAISSGINQWRDHPREWGQGMSGYGRRYGYRFARHAVAHGIEWGVGELLQEEPRYFRSTRAGFWPRTRYAIVNTFLAPHNGGSKRFAVARISAKYGSAFIANTWYPERLATSRHAVTRGTISIGWDIAENVFIEFWPDIKRKFLHRGAGR